ncbi:MAG: HAMP domain-containing histidine kinase [Clostridia bacterium]|nr:HAMP domain-containing histidine kinase [Clostridia bacterium]
MTDKKRFIPLRLKMLIILGVAIAVAAATFMAAREAGNFLVWRYYSDADAAQEREQRHIEKLQDYVTERKLSTADKEKVLKWSGGKFVYAVIYENSDLLYSPDWFEDFNDEDVPDPFKESEFYESWFSGDRGFEQYLTEEARQKYSETLDSILEGNRELHPLYCVDGTLLVALVDNSREVAQNAVIAVAFILAIAVIAIVTIVSFSRTVSRVNRLAQDVKTVRDGALEAPIDTKGNDDIAALARDVDSMRASLIENMTEERRTREANSALITAMSHDVRTPLTVLMGYLDLIEMSDLDSASAEYLAVCRENAQRLKKLSDDLFSYFLVFGKKDMDIQLSPVSLNGEIAAMIAEHVFLLREKGYEIDMPSDVPEAAVLCDMAYFGRVIDNIFSNVSKYADVTAPIKIDVDTDGKRAYLCFANKIRRDRSLPESNRIGLKTCGKIVEQMGGELAINETEDNFEIAVKLNLEE